jgi:DNA-binding FadR family transcriptional regulator
VAMQLSDQSVRRPGRRYIGVAQDVLGAVAAGRFAVGERLPTDRELAVQHGVSRATAREAVLALELIGVVEVRHGDGVYLQSGPVRVGGLESSALDSPPQELIESRRVVEPAVAELVASRIGADELAVLADELAEAEEIVRDPLSLPRFMDLGLHFHSRLAAGCGNSLLTGVVTQFVDAEAHPLWTLVNQHAMGSTEARLGQLSEHQAVFRAVRDRDAPAAGDAMRRHLEHLARIIFAAPGQPETDETTTTDAPASA